MIARERRRALAAVGTDLVARHGGPGERRGQALLRRLAQAPHAAVGLDDLAAVPGWLRLPEAAQRQVATRAALLSMAPALAGSIDGALLRGHAEVAGEDALDWALEAAGQVAAEPLPPVAPERLRARGLALMRAALPERLRPLLSVDAEALEPSPALAERCVAAAWTGTRGA